MTKEQTQALTRFLHGWNTDPNRTKDCFFELKQHLESLDDIELSFIDRPGVTYSLRATHARQTIREFFAMVDIIDDDPANRWLSVCFYKEFVDDPQALGDEVPGGLMGEDATCFDLFERNDIQLDYILARISMASRNAAMEHLTGLT